MAGMPACRLASLPGIVSIDPKTLLVEGTMIVATHYQRAGAGLTLALLALFQPGVGWSQGTVKHDHFLQSSTEARPQDPCSRAPAGRRRSS